MCGQLLELKHRQKIFKCLKEVLLNEKADYNSGHLIDGSISRSLQQKCSAGVKS